MSTMTAEDAIADTEAFADWLMGASDEEVEAIQAELDVLWQEYEDPDDDPGGGTPVDVPPAPRELAEPDTRGPPGKRNRPPRLGPGQAAIRQLHHHHERAKDTSAGASVQRARCRP